MNDGYEVGGHIAREVRATGQVVERVPGHVLGLTTRQRSAGATTDGIMGVAT
jgi:hypothetical protein